MTLTVINSKDINIDFTCLQGYIRATKEELIEVFGPITWDENYDKVTCEWDLEFTDQDGNKTVATIYDWKTDGVPFGETYSWHIGGFDHKAVEYVNAYFKMKTK